MPWTLFGISFLLGTVTGFATFSRGWHFIGPVGQVIQGLLSIACFGAIVVAFWSHGWKAGIADVFIVFGGGNVGLSVFKYMARR